MFTLSGKLLGREVRTGTNTNRDTGEMVPYHYVQVAILSGLDSIRCRIDESVPEGSLPPDGTDVVAQVRVTAYKLRSEAALAVRVLGIEAAGSDARRAG